MAPRCSNGSTDEDNLDCEVTRHRATLNTSNTKENIKNNEETSLRRQHRKFRSRLGCVQQAGLICVVVEMGADPDIM